MDIETTVKSPDFDNAVVEDAGDDEQGVKDP